MTIKNNADLSQIHYKTLEVEGINIFYRDAGPLDGPTILLLHGFPTSSHMYRNLIHNLKGKYRLIAPDYPGFGFSDFPDLQSFEYSFEHLSQVMESFIKLLELKSFSLYVQDYGAPIGFRIIHRHPEWLDCLIIQNANAYEKGIGPIFDPILSVWSDPSPANKKRVTDLFEFPTTRFQYEDGASDPSRIAPETYHLDQLLMDRPGNKEIQFLLQYDYRNNPPQYPLWHAMFRSVQPPTLVVWGENDQFFTKEGALAYSEDLKKIEFNFYPAGHFALEEYHEDIAAKIDTFLEAQGKG